MKCSSAYRWQGLAVMALVSFVSSTFPVRAAAPDLKRQPNAEAEKKGVLIFKDYKNHQYTFENTNADKLVHFSFKFQTMSFSGSIMTTYLTRTHAELDIPPKGKVTYDIPLELQSCTVKVLSINRVDPPKSALPPKKP